MKKLRSCKLGTPIKCPCKKGQIDEEPSRARHNKSEYIFGCQCGRRFRLTVTGRYYLIR